MICLNVYSCYVLYILSRVYIAGYLCVQAEDGIRDLVRSRGLGDVYKRQMIQCVKNGERRDRFGRGEREMDVKSRWPYDHFQACLLYTSDAADERSSVDLGGRRIIKKKKQTEWAIDGLDSAKYNTDRCSVEDRERKR